MKGGARVGAGRKKGVKNAHKRMTLKDHLTTKDIATFMEFLLANYMEDSRLMMWMGDHIFGKAPQPITGGDGGNLVIEISEAVAKKHAAHARPDPNR